MEKRATPRKPVLMSGAIEFAGSVINCLISNISMEETGQRCLRQRLKECRAR